MCATLADHAAKSPSACCSPSGSSRNAGAGSSLGTSKPSGTRLLAIARQPGKTSKPSSFRDAHAGSERSGDERSMAGRIVPRETFRTNTDTPIRTVYARCIRSGSGGDSPEKGLNRTMHAALDLSHSTAWTVDPDRESDDPRAREYSELGWLAHLNEIIGELLGLDG